MMANIGKSISIQGRLTGDEDLLVEGAVEGEISLSSNELTIGAAGRVVAEVQAKSVVVVGRVKGNVTASERVHVQASGVVEGDVTAPRIAIDEGATLEGRIRMESGAPSRIAAPASRRSDPLPRTAVAAGAGLE